MAPAGKHPVSVLGCLSNSSCVCSACWRQCSAWAPLIAMRIASAWSW